MPRVGFEPTTPVFEQVKTVHALDRAATVIDTDSLSYRNIFLWNIKYSIRITSEVLYLHFQHQRCSINIFLSNRYVSIINIKYAIRKSNSILNVMFQANEIFFKYTENNMLLENFIIANITI
jgi:hypothetical protein